MSTSTVIKDSLKAAGRLASEIGKAATEALFPAKCLSCGEFIEQALSASPDASNIENDASNCLHLTLAPFTCTRCLSGIQEVSSPFCECCGQVFASRAGQDHICESCIRAPNHFQRARSAIKYNDLCASLVHAFKYNGKIQLARPFGIIMAQAFDTFWSAEDIDLAVPVPLHRRRLKTRGFNQVGLMMREWARYLEKNRWSLASVVFNSNILVRVRHTQPQTGLGLKERPQNLRGAFGLKPGANISGMRLLLIDDIYTTGATANEAARALLKHGAVRVDVLTLARAV